MKSKNKICILILTGIYIYFISIFNVKAEMVNVELTSANWYIDNSNNGWKTNAPYLLQKAGWTGFKVYDFNNINFYATANVRLYMTNGSLLAGKNASFSIYLDGMYLDLVGITLLDNNSAYTCEVYSAINNETTNVYNIVCPNLPASVNSNSFSINTYINWNGGGETYVHNFKLGVSGINAWSSENSQIANNTNDIKNKMNEDISQSDKDAPNQTEYNNAKQQEDNIIQSISNVSPNDITFSQDLQATNKIWETTTRFLQTNAKVMGLVISILSIGIIKLIMNR